MNNHLQEIIGTRNYSFFLSLSFSYTRTHKTSNFLGGWGGVGGGFRLLVSSRVIVDHQIVLESFDLKMAHVIEEIYVINSNYYFLLQISHIEPGNWIKDILQLQ